MVCCGGEDPSTLSTPSPCCDLLLRALFGLDLISGARVDAYTYVTQHAHVAGAYGGDDSGWVSLEYHLVKHMDT